MNNEQLIQLRFNLALKMGDSRSIEELELLMKWIVGTPSTIVPASAIVVKP
jgi:hypothetical protein